MRKINPDFRRIFILVAFTSLATIYAIIWARMITDNAQRTGTDFIAFYAGGRVAQEFGFNKAYDIQLQKAVQEEQVGFALDEKQVLIYIHPPFILPILWLIASANYVSSFIVWSFLSLGCYIVSLTLLVKQFSGGASDFVSKMAYWGGGLLFFPVFISLLLGQDTAILFLGVSIWLFGLTTKRAWLAGLGLGLISIRPHMALLLTIPFAFSLRKVFFWAVFWGLLLAIFSVLLVKVEGAAQFINILLTSASGEGHGTNEEDMFNLIGIFFRVFPHFEREVLRNAAWGVYALSIVGLSIAWKSKHIIDEKKIGLAIVLSVLVAPHLHYHDLALLWFPLVFITKTLPQHQPIRLEQALTLLLGISLVLMFGHLLPALRFVTPYLVMLLCAAALISLNAGRTQLPISPASDAL